LAVSESFVFAVLGGIAGLALGQWALQGLLPLVGASLPRTASIALDGRAAVFTCGVSTVLGIVFGAGVAAHGPGRLPEALKGAARTTTPAGHVARTRSLLVVGQVTLAVVLLSAAGLMMTSVGRLSHVSPGFDAAHLLTFRIAITGSNYAAPSRTA